ncbi:lysostaphin resistance A-like protein [Dactylosporangium sp. CA-233914]|uniref:CPBP family intramembrane glutamic endopeptidase n=1 Tax=Dactylosporangium sp. CA-233914 TaxID=3239934 RepID=UPI003D8DDEB4
MSPTPIEFHRLARTDAYRWWRPPLGTLLLLVVGLIGMVAVYTASEGIAAIAGRPADADGVHSWGDAGDTAVYLFALALLIPCVLAAARWVQRRPAGTVSSVQARLRWGWLGVCGLAAAPTLALMYAADALLIPGDGLSGDWVGPGRFALTMLPLLLLVPLQSAAEEYVCRGWLLQAVGAYVRRPWLPIAVQALAFAAAHGWGTAWGFADLVLFGATAGWLTVRTGGLEAAIALHVVNNLVSFALSAATGDLGSDGTATDSPWQILAIDVVLLPAYAAAIAWLARRRNLVTTAASATTGEAVLQPV